jgi:hypothetical protein
MKKNYIIRKVLFIHNDLENIAVGLGDVVGIFDEYENAYEAYLSCERHQYQKWHLSSFEIPVEDKELIIKMQEFFQKYFPQTSDFHEILQIPLLPTHASLEQTAEFIKITGLQHYELLEYEQMPAYYKIKMVDEFWGEEADFPFTVFPTEVEALYLLQASQEEATHEALGVAFSYLWQDMLEETDFDFAGLKGKLTDLSQTPDALAHYIENCRYFWYDNQKQKIYLSPTVQEAETQEVLKELSGLCDLLIQKPFFITRLDLEAMRHKFLMLGE